MEKEYTLEGETVEAVYESYQGDYWVIADDTFGFACLAAMRQFAEWGTINRRELENNPRIWEVPRENWTFCGPEQIDIQEA